MKFDSLMSFLYKCLCLITAAVCVAGLIVSCSSDCIEAKALGGEVPKWYWDYLTQSCKEYLEIENNRKELIQPRVTEAVQSPELTPAEKNAILGVYGLQETYFNELDNEFSTAFRQSPVLPSTFSIDDDSTIGIYISALDDLAHAVQIYAFSQDGATVCSSDEFNIIVNIADDSGDMLQFENYEDMSSNWLYRGLRVRPLGLAYGLSITLTQTGGYFTSLPSYVSSSNVGQMLIYTELGRSTSNFLLSRSGLVDLFTGNGSQLGAMGVIASLPPATVDTSAVWDYYNDILLPYIYETYPGVSDDYLFFPDGYSPPEPTEPPTFPNGGIAINYNDYFVIDSSGIPVTDESGVPVTDESGETVTETVYIVDTAPTDGIYNFMIPTLPAVEIPSGDFPLFSPGSDLVQTCSGFFSGMTTFYTESGLDSAVPAFVAISAALILVRILL